MYTPKKNHPSEILKIGENILKWRKEKGITRHDLAKNLHISSKILRKVEENQVVINHLQIRIIAAHSKIKFSRLLIDPTLYYQINGELVF